MPSVENYFCILYLDTKKKCWARRFTLLRERGNRPHTDRFPDDVLKKLWQNRNCDSCEENATGAEKTGIRRIPAGIGN
jgi:hypothetical protein